MKNNVNKEIMLKNVISIFEYPQGEVFKIINKNGKLLDSLQKNMEIIIELVLVAQKDIKIP